jgi:hypothetical protein
VLKFTCLAPVTLAVCLTACAVESELEAFSQTAELSTAQPGQLIGRYHLRSGTSGRCAQRSGSSLIAATCDNSRTSAQNFDIFQSNDGAYFLCVPDSVQLVQDGLIQPNTWTGFGVLADYYHGTCFQNWTSSFRDVALTYREEGSQVWTPKTGANGQIWLRDSVYLQSGFGNNTYLRRDIGNNSIGWKDSFSSAENYQWSVFQP